MCINQSTLSDNGQHPVLDTKCPESAGLQVIARKSISCACDRLDNSVISLSVTLNRFHKLRWRRYMASFSVENQVSCWWYTWSKEQRHSKSWYWGTKKQYFLQSQNLLIMTTDINLCSPIDGLLLNTILCDVVIYPCPRYSRNLFLAPKLSHMPCSIERARLINREIENIGFRAYQEI